MDSLLESTTMRISILLVVFLFSSISYASPCAESAKVVMPQIAANTKADFEKKLAKARSEHVADTNDPDKLIWYGRRTAYLGDYKKAIHIYSEGIRMHPADARMYRHRGSARYL